MRECVVRMEMPKRCESCGLRCICEAFNDLFTTKEDGRSKLKVGMEGCLILCQLPEGHGRLIDWDAFERAGFKLCRKTSEWIAELGTPTNESYVVPAERSET